MKSLSLRQKRCLLVVLFLSTVLTMAEGIMSPTYNALYEKFPNHLGWINFAITGCYLVSFLLGFVVDRICVRVSRKAMLLAGGLIGTAGAAGMIFFFSPVSIAISRAFLQVAYTLTFTVTMTIFNEMYEDANERARKIGYYNGFGMIVSSGLSMASGYLAVTSVQSAFRLHILIVLYLAAVVFFVPNIQKDTPEVSARSENKEKTVSAKLGKNYWITVVNYGLFTAAVCSGSFFSSIYVIENGLGTEATVGTMASVVGLFSFAVSILFGGFFEKQAKNLALISYGLSALAAFLLALYPSMLIAYLGFGILSVTMVSNKIYYYTLIPRTVPENALVKAIARISILTTIGTTVSSYFVTFVREWMQISYTSFLLIPGCIFVLNLFVAWVDRKHYFTK